MNPYSEFVQKIANAIKAAREIPLGEMPVPPVSPPDPDAPVGMIFSPHPDDECITGGLALRLQRQSGFRIVNVAVTLGSDAGRREARRSELENACRFLGFELEYAARDGFPGIDPESRETGKENWEKAVDRIAGLLAKWRPQVVFYPHRHDRHPTHCGTSLLVADALGRISTECECFAVETEYWQALKKPNLLVEIDQRTIGDLIAALSFHRGEVRRNPYHISLPAWMIDNVRRGSEIVGPAGGTAANFLFGVLHRVSHFRHGRFVAFGEGRPLAAAADPLALLKD